MHAFALLVVLGTALGAFGLDEWDRCSEGPCDCLRNFLRVRCRFLPIEDIVAGQYFPSDTDRLDLRDNGMQRLPDNFFRDRPMPALKDLRLRDNPLTELTSRDFVDLGHLRWLSLDNTQLTQLPEDLFFELKSIRILYIIRNYLLESLPDSLFYGLSELRQISIDLNTKLTEIPRRLLLEVEDTIQFLVIRSSDLITENGLPNNIVYSADTANHIQLEDIGFSVLRRDVFGNLSHPLSSVSVRFNRGLQ